MTSRWSAATRLRWFYGTLAASALSVAWLFWPFLDVIVFAGVVAAVSTPLHVRLVERFRGRRVLAAICTTLIFAVVVLLPVSLILWRFIIEAIEFGRVVVAWATAGGLADVAARIEMWVEQSPWLRRLAGDGAEGTDPLDLVLQPLQQTLVGGLGTASSLLPGLVQGLATSIIDVALFVFTVVTLLSEGPRLTRFLFDISPLDERYERQLLAVFQEFATNIVVGAFVVAFLQGAVATIGYILFGVPRALFFGVLTGVSSFVPLVGTAVVAVPTSLYVGWVHGWGWGAGLILWSAAVVGTVDNFVRPIVLRGNTDIHPLLIFLAVFGGLRWMGVAGVLIGPVLVAFFLALATIHREEHGTPQA